MKWRSNININEEEISVCVACVKYVIQRINVANGNSLAGENGGLEGNEGLAAKMAAIES
jgi:hypothetical protein